MKVKIPVFIFTHFFCLVGCVYHMFSIMRVYLEYSSIINMKMNTTNQLPIPVVTVFSNTMAGLSKRKLSEEYPKFNEKLQEIRKLSKEFDSHAIKNLILLLRKLLKLSHITANELNNFTSTKIPQIKTGSYHKSIPQNIIRTEISLFLTRRVLLDGSNLTLDAITRNGAYYANLTIINEPNDRIDYENDVIALVLSHQRNIVPFMTEWVFVYEKTTCLMTFRRTLKYLLPTPYETKCINYLKDTFEKVTTELYQRVFGEPDTES